MPLSEVIERVKGLAKPPNEEATKLQVVLPILRELGWDAYDPSRVQPEFGVGGGRVDLALFAPDRAVALIEVKAVGIRLEEHVEQTLRYAFHEGADICVLTTGLVWWLYLPREKGQPDERRFAELDLSTESVDELVTDFSTYLGYEDLVGHRAEGHAKAALEARLHAKRLDGEMPRVWASMLAEPPQALIELIQDRVSVEVGLRPSNEQVSSFLNGRESGAGTSPPPIRATRSAPRNQNTVSDGQRPQTPGRRPSAPISGFELWGRRQSAQRWTDVWEGVVRSVLERNPGSLAQAVGRPRGKRSYVELEPGAISEASRVGKPRQVGVYWIDVHGSSKALQERCEYLLELCGYSKADLTYMTD